MASVEKKAAEAGPGGGGSFFGAGPASGGLSRAEFFAKKLGKSGASKSPPKPVEGVEDASEDFEKL